MMGRRLTVSVLFFANLSVVCNTFIWWSSLLQHKIFSFIRLQLCLIVHKFRQTFATVHLLPVLWHVIFPFPTVSLRFVWSNPAAIRLSCVFSPSPISDFCLESHRHCGSCTKNRNVSSRSAICREWKICALLVGVLEVVFDIKILEWHSETFYSSNAFVNEDLSMLHHG